MPQPKPVRGRVLLRLLLLVVVPMAAAIVGAYWYTLGGRYVTTDNAYVKANVVGISTSIDGRVISVPIRDNEVVAKGGQKSHHKPSKSALRSNTASGTPIAFFSATSRSHKLSRA